MSDNQVIPEAAVEAAVDALVASRLGDHAGINGEEFVEAARAVLEAAAPHLTGAWEEGYGQGYKHGYADCLKLYGHDAKEDA